MKITDSELTNIIENPTEYANKLEVKDLEKLLRYFSSKYYESESIVDDNVFDMLVDVLSQKSPNNPFLTEVGSSEIKDSVDLDYPMSSLNKIKSDDKKAFQLWIRKFEGPYVIADKLDGISVSLVSKNNSLTMHTRSTATTGVDISNIIKFLFDRRYFLKFRSLKFATRGELIISKKNFEKIKNVYKNPRNAIKGIITKLNPEHLKLLDFVAYELMFPEKNTKNEQLQTLDSMGFKTVKYISRDKITKELLDEYLTSRKDNSDYEIDGLVITNDNSVSKPTSDNPKYSIAYKKMFDYQIAKTTVTDIIWSASMYGYLVPVVIIKPVNVSGTTISRATGHNAKFIVDNKIGKGATILIVRSGDVIPKISKVITPSKNPLMPKILYEWDETKVNIIATDIETEDVLVKKLVHFFKELGVKFLSESTLKKFMSVGLNSIEDIMLFTPDQVSSIDGLGTKSASKIRTNMTTAIEKAELSQYMSGSLMFGRGFGSERAKLILDEIPDLFSVKYDENTLYDKVSSIHGLGEITSTQFVKGYPKFMKFYRFLVDNNLFIEEDENENEVGEQILQDHIIVLTGFRDDNLKTKIISLGGKVTSAVSKKTTILLYSDGSSDQSSKKFITAKKNGTMIMSRSEFIKKYIGDK